jgi:hypothetical protein
MRIIFVVVVIRSELLIISRMRETSFSSFTSILIGIIVSGVKVLIFAALAFLFFVLKHCFADLCDQVAFLFERHIPQLQCLARESTQGMHVWICH